MVNEIRWGQRSYTKSEFVHAWTSCKTKSDIARKLGLPLNGGNINTITKTGKILGLDDSHFDKYWSHRLQNPNRIIVSNFTSTKANFLNKLTKNNYTSNTHSLKHQLYKHGLKKQQCEECGLIEWNGKPAPLALDHIDGDRSNNTLENLRILCYNCHGQTETYSGKKHANLETRIQLKIKREETSRIKIQKRQLKQYCFCGNSKSSSAKECMSCHQNKIKANVSDRYPELNELIVMIQSSTYVAVASKLGVSDNALRKHLKKRLPESHPILNIKPRIKR